MTMKMSLRLALLACWAVCGCTASGEQQSKPAVNADAQVMQDVNPRNPRLRHPRLGGT